MIAPGLLASMPRAAADRFRQFFPDLAECAPHEARLTIEEIRNAKIKAPAIRVVMMDIRPRKDAYASGPAAFYDIAMAAFVITKNLRGLPREDACLNICEGVMRALIGQQLGIEDLGEAEAIHLRNLNDSLTRARGLALAAVVWTQPVMLAEAPSDPGPLPASIYVGVDPEIGADHEDDYVLVSDRDAPS